MITTLMIFHAVISVFLILIVLLQFGKGAEAGLFSGGGSDAVFTSGQQGNILSKMTVVLSVIFLGNCVLLARMQSENTGKSIMDSEAPITRPLNSDVKETQSSSTDAKVEEKNTPTATAKEIESKKSDEKGSADLKDSTKKTKIKENLEKSSEDKK